MALLLEEKKFDENNRVSNLRIGVGLGMIAITCVSYLYRYGDDDFHLPNSYNFQFVCCVIYFAIQAMYYYVEWFEVGDLFFTSNGAPGKNYEKVEFRSKINKEKATYDLKVLSFGKAVKEDEQNLSWNVSD